MFKACTSTIEADARHRLESKKRYMVHGGTGLGLGRNGVDRTEEHGGRPGRATDDDDQGCGAIWEIVFILSQRKMTVMSI